MSTINSRQNFLVTLSLSASLFASPVLANEDLCAPIQQRVNQAYQERINATKPTISAGEYVQQAYDIKGILSQNVTSAFSKLLSLDFSGIANSIVNSAMSKIGQKAANAIQGAVFNPINNAVNQATNQVNNAVNQATNQVNNAVNTAVNQAPPVLYVPIQPAPPPQEEPTGPYSWVKAKVNDIFGK